MKFWKIALACLMALACLDPALLRHAAAQTMPPVALFQGPWPPAETQANVNHLIVSLNAILSPLIPNVPGAVNLIELNPATTGNLATISLQSAADANGGLAIQPNGSGNVQFFSMTNTGSFQFGINQFPYQTASFQTSRSFAPCPGAPVRQQATASPITPAATMQGFMAWKDWLGNTHWWGVC